MGAPRAGEPESAESEATRESFLDRLRRMDPGGWEELYRRYREMILARSRQAGLPESDGEDIAQDVFLALAKRPPGPSPRPGSFRHYLCNLTRWRIQDQLRRRGRQPSLEDRKPESDSDPAAVESLPDHDDFSRRWDAEFDRHVHDLALNRLMAATDPRQFRAFQLVQYQGWPPRRAARELGLASATVYVIRHRLNRHLRREIESLLAELDRVGVEPT